jgi:hypothetical protein
MTTPVKPCRHPVRHGVPAASQILENYYQGGWRVLLDQQFFLDRSITHCVSVTDMRPNHPGLEVLHVYVADDPEADIGAHLASAVRFIYRARCNGKAVYTHCTQGISRSSTMTIAYLMTWLGFSVQAAWEALRKGRNAARPNPGFFKALERFEADAGEEGLASLRASLEAEFQPTLLAELQAMDAAFLSTLPPAPNLPPSTPRTPKTHHHRRSTPPTQPPSHYETIAALLDVLLVNHDREERNVVLAALATENVQTMRDLLEVPLKSIGDMDAPDRCKKHLARYLISHSAGRKPMSV